jgi:hypothetical protein
VNYRLIVFVVLAALTYLMSWKQKSSTALDPRLEVRPRIFRTDESSASASSSDDGALGLCDDDASQGPLTICPMPCACGVECPCGKVAASAEAVSELELQMELVNQLVQIDELKKENEQLKLAAAQPVAAQPVAAQPTPMACALCRGSGYYTTVDGRRYWCYACQGTGKPYPPAKSVVPTRTTYGNYQYSYGNCSGGNCYPQQGGRFFRRW